ncbi:hypothetical protein [Ruegeria marina]|uniref:Uncharacterized protein n=1 Tax=Ruegeria marina TaxID=639004 RepID=A0A1G7D9D3_9RHOB|nr:hypothetical protein [Ruegeria marina]SDE48123.1 hypothetical protein SAMN04488239_12060 [Ruegeria marina]
MTKEVMCEFERMRIVTETGRQTLEWLYNHSKHPQRRQIAKKALEEIDSGLELHNSADTSSQLALSYAIVFMAIGTAGKELQEAQ